MQTPECPKHLPAIVEPEPGTYYWCSCGRSESQPYCDGSHKGTDFHPVEFRVEEKKMLALCQRKRTANGPFCDGAHKNQVARAES